MLAGNRENIIVKVMHGCGSGGGGGGVRGEIQAKEGIQRSIAVSGKFARVPLLRLVRTFDLTAETGTN